MCISAKRQNVSIKINLPKCFSGKSPSSEKRAYKGISNIHQIHVYKVKIYNSNYEFNNITYEKYEFMNVYCTQQPHQYFAQGL